MSALGEAAEAYAAMGWAVLPLGRASKVPAVQGGCRAASDDPEQARAWWAARPDHNVGVATGAASGGLLVVDVDVDPGTGEDGLAELSRWEREHGPLPPTVEARTGRGGRHLYFRCAAGIRNSANKGLGIDVRGEGGYVAAPPSAHPNGGRYEWVRAPWDFEVAEADEGVLAFVRHVQGDRAGSAGGRAAGGGAHGRFELPELIEAGGRNDTLFRYAASLQARGCGDGEIAEAVEAANRERCIPPLPAADVATICASAGRYEKGRGGAAGGRAFRRLDRQGRPTGPVLHNVVARELIESRRACVIDGAPAIWDGRRYATGWEEVTRAIIGLIDDCKIADQREIRNYLLHMAPRVEAAPPTLIAFENGVLDLKSGELAPAGDAVITNVIPHDYDPCAYSAEADCFLDEVSCGVPEVRANLEEVVGMCMYRASDFGQCPVLIGAGSNGKSTYILALRNVLGNENVSSLDLNVVGKQFQAGRLLGKLANLGDDISNERLTGDVLAVFKKVVTGEWIYSDVKGGDGFEFRPYCTLLFSCNEVPRLGDSSEGMMRRLFPIPFDAHFDRRDPGYDARLWEKLTTEEAARYLARVGVEGLLRLLENNGLTPNRRSDELAGEVRVDNDSVLQWLDDELLEAGDFLEEPIAPAYERYRSWCLGSNRCPFGRKKFTRKIGERFGLESVPTTLEYADGRRSVRVFRRREGAPEGAGNGPATD